LPCRREAVHGVTRRRSREDLRDRADPLASGDGRVPVSGEAADRALGRERGARDLLSRPTGAGGARLRENAPGDPYRAGTRHRKVGQAHRRLRPRSTSRANRSRRRLPASGLRLYGSRGLLLQEARQTLCLARRARSGSDTVRVAADASRAFRLRRQADTRIRDTECVRHRDADETTSRAVAASLRTRPECNRAELSSAARAKAEEEPTDHRRVATEPEAGAWTGRVDT